MVCKFTACTVYNFVTTFKSCGLDGVSAEHLKHSSNRIVPMLAMCFTGFFIHGMLPPSMISVEQVPIVKDKRASVCSTSNYRPIALASIMSKLLEKIILEWTTSLDTSSRTLFVCRGRRGPGTVSSGIYRPPFCAVGTNVRRWLSYSHWQAYIHYAFIRQMASFLVSDSLTLGV